MIDIAVSFFIQNSTISLLFHFRNASKYFQFKLLLLDKACANRPDLGGVHRRFCVNQHSMPAQPHAGVTEPTARCKSKLTFYPQCWVRASKREDCFYRLISYSVTNRTLAIERDLGFLARSNAVQGCRTYTPASEVFFW